MSELTRTTMDAVGPGSSPAPDSPLVPALRRAPRGPGGKVVSRVLHLAEIAAMTLAFLGVLGAVAFFTVPKVMGWHGVIVLTGSMEPALRTGGLAFIDEGINPESVRVGDIITFKDPQAGDGVATRNITHRVYGVVRDGSALSFRTKGDANQDPDQTLVPASDLVGREVFAVAHVGNWSNWIKEKGHFYMILWLPAALVIAAELSNILRDLRKKDLHGQKETAS